MDFRLLSGLRLHMMRGMKNPVKTNVANSNSQMIISTGKERPVPAVVSNSVSQ